MPFPFSPRSSVQRRDEAADAGYMLLTVVVMVALVLIALSVAAPVVAKDLRRDKELESEHRAEQYVRAIRLFYRKTHNYPASMDALKQTNNIRFLRQEYVDPLTGKSDWRILHLGEQKTTVKGFFGQELGNLPAAGLGSAAGLNAGVGTPVGAGTSTTSTIGATSALASGFSGASITSTTGGAGANGATGSTGAFGSSGSTGSTGGLGGGGVIVGVGTARTGPSLATPNAQTTYETWEFWYDPRIEQLYQKGQTNAGIGSGALGSQPASSLGGASGFGTPVNGTSNPGGFGTPTTSPTTSSPTSSTPQ